MMRAAVHCVLLALVCLTGCNDSRTSTTSPSTVDPHVRREVPLEYGKVFSQPKLGDEAVVSDDGGRAKRRHTVERAHHAVAELDVGLVWHESEGLVVTVIVGQGRCSRGLLAKLVATIKKAGVDLRAEGFEKIACSVDPATLSL